MFNLETIESLPNSLQVGSKEKSNIPIIYLLHCVRLQLNIWLDERLISDDICCWLTVKALSQKMHENGFLSQNCDC